MGRTIQIVPIADGVSIFITDVKENMITFRSSRMPEQLKKVKVENIENDMVFFDNYHCHINYINKFLAENTQ